MEQLPGLRFRAKPGTVYQCCRLDDQPVYPNCNGRLAQGYLNSIKASLSKRVKAWKDYTFQVLTLFANLEDIT
jgi:hypothetical protein